MGDLNETQRYFIDEHVEDYMDGLISRRELLRRVTLISGSAVLAATIVAACGTPAPSGAGGVATQSAAASAAGTAFVPQAYATPPPSPVPDGVTVKETDPRIAVSKPEVKGSDGASLMAYMAKPVTNARVPGIVVIHENRGQTEHIKDVVRRVATAGFVGINIDLAARDGGAAKLTDQAAYNAALGKRTGPDKVADHNATIAFLKTQSSGTVGVTGFCFGGGETWSILAAGADVKAAVPFYGPQPTNYLDMAKTKAAVSAVYAELDTRITTSSMQMEQVLKSAGVDYKITIYPGVNHAFHNDTGTPDRYNAEQAQKAWVATIEWFRKYLV
ncbi:MAG: dienelactone hydrolase family protein [Chloroflexota bacterium]|nr:dienelactone hydrolase family protein [Chloroflexota bacterium]